MDIIIKDLDPESVLEGSRAIALMANSYFEKGRKLRDAKGDNPVTARAYLTAKALLDINKPIIEALQKEAGLESK